MPLKQLVHTLSYGDAISNEVCCIKSLAGGEVVCLHVHHKLEHEARKGSSLEELQEMIAGTDTLLLHYSLGSVLNEAFLASDAKRKIVLFHNLTPAHWYEPYNERVVTDLKSGLGELPEIVSGATAVWSDSLYNQKMLEEICGELPDPMVLPYVFYKSRWDRLSSNQGIVSALKSGSGPNILHVGRIAPNKCIEDIIKAFYFYHFKIQPESRLWLVGSAVDTEIYMTELVKLIMDLGLTEAVRFVGGVSDEELKAFYEASDLYLLMSEHEGFCVPLLEAMAAGLPVVAFSQPAVEETGKDYIYSFNSKEHELVAELMEHVLSDEEFISSAGSLGQACLERFSEENFASTLKRTLSESSI